METNNKIHGTNYYLAGRYDYTAIDRTYENTSGTADVLSGIKPKKLAESILYRMEECQRDSLRSLAMAILAGDSANSEELFLYTINDRGIYDSLRSNYDKRLREFFNEYPRDNWGSAKAFEFSSIVSMAADIFRAGAEKYETEFPKGRGNDWYNFTPLDFMVCAIHYINRQYAEWKVNGLK